MQQLRKKKATNQRKRVTPFTHPPPIEDFFLSNPRKMRYISTAANTYNITFQNLLDTVIFMGESGLGVASYDVFQLVKVKSIEIWTPATSAGATQSIALMYGSVTVGNQGDNKLHTDSSMGVTPAHIYAKPGPRSLAGFWNPSTTDVAFTVTLPANTVIDVNLVFRSNLNIIVATQNAVAAPGFGAQYYRGLDGKAIAATNFDLPLGVFGEQA